ncbi:DUF2255 family protein [Ruania zhangjianzhongii]|uniref:DUF2255 family protein n=1 Tax=Ruania zhangjianzhongii TaxID=2603206 RepID=UPI0011C94E66|nr:DUF2255 family protein [Ruania zhangjianzhongii]
MAFDNVVKTLDETQVVAIVTTRAAGQTIATPIWSMVVDGVPYVRSAFGEDSWWYRHINAGRPVAFVDGDGSLAERDREAALALPRDPVATTYVPADDPVQSRIDEEIVRKYAGARQASVDAMLSPQARECTLKVEAPAAT